jgi:hypothetical protein
MSKITQKQLIDQIKALKEIKPRKEWAVLLKSQILEEKKLEPIQEQSAGLIDIFCSVFFQKKLAYSFAAVLFLIVGIVSFTKLLPTEKMPQQIASLTTQTESIQNVADLNNKISDLAKATKESSAAGNDINTKISALAKSLKNTQVKDPQTIKKIAKTLADISGKDLNKNSDQDVKDIYQTIVQSQIADLQKTTLNNDQKNALAKAKDLYDTGKYGEALEKILLISK